jgi:TRAP transporter TAXI family solute receptor
MRLGSLFGVIGTLCAIATSTSIPAASPDWPKTLTLASSSPGGTFYILGEEIARVLTEKLEITVNHLPTQGPAQNVKLLDIGGAQLGMISMGVIVQGWNGTGDWTNHKQFRNMRALFPMWGSIFQIVALRRSGITTLAQLDKKRIGIGARASLAGVYAPDILKVLGISAEAVYASTESINADLLSGRLDAILTMLGTPVPVIQEVEVKEPITFIGLSSEQIEAIRKAMPELGPAKIAAGTYRALEKDYATIGMFNFVVGRTDLPDDLAYQLVKAVLENQPRLVKVNSAASEILPQNVEKNTFLPFHPGAVRYYREIGISIPRSLVPTN